MNPKTFHVFLYCLTLIVILIQFKTVNGVDPLKPTAKADSTTRPNNITKKPNISEDCINCTKAEDQNLFQHLLNNKPMLMRAFYVLLAVTSIVIVYFVMRAWRLRRKRSKSRKYGLITARGTDMEMAPLDQDDDEDDDMTVFDMNSQNRRKK